jgi:hypothetical protein
MTQQGPLTQATSCGGLLVRSPGPTAVAPDQLLHELRPVADGHLCDAHHPTGALVHLHLDVAGVGVGQGLGAALGRGRQQQVLDALHVDLDVRQLWQGAEVMPVECRVGDCPQLAAT